MHNNGGLRIVELCCKFNLHDQKQIWYIFKMD